MADISLTRNHSLGVAEARDRVDTILDELKGPVTGKIEARMDQHFA